MSAHPTPLDPGWCFILGLLSPLRCSRLNLFTSVLPGPWPRLGKLGLTACAGLRESGGEEFTEPGEEKETLGGEEKGASTVRLSTPCLSISVCCLWAPQQHQEVIFASLVLQMRRSRSSVGQGTGTEISPSLTLIICITLNSFTTIPAILPSSLTILLSYTDLGCWSAQGRASFDSVGVNVLGGRCLSVMLTSGCCFWGSTRCVHLGVGSGHSREQESGERAYGGMMSPLVWISWHSDTSSNKGRQGTAWVRVPQCEPHLF